MNHQEVISKLGQLVKSGMLWPIAPNLDGRRVCVVSCIDTRYQRTTIDFFRQIAGSDVNFLGFYPELGGALRFATHPADAEVHRWRIGEIVSLFGTPLDFWLLFHQPDCKWCEHQRPVVDLPAALEKLTLAAQRLKSGVSSGVSVRTGLLADIPDIGIQFYELDSAAALTRLGSSKVHA